MRLVDRERHREAGTSRPALLGGVARQSHAGQTRLNVNLTHAKEKLTRASEFLSAVIATAEQLSQSERWRRILAKIFEKYLGDRKLATPVPALVSG